jgi:4-hydroxy-L-threonine phosphate dehydrogenase PdxA
MTSFLDTLNFCRTGRPGFLGKPVAEVPVRMMLANDELRTVLVSIHVSLRDAIELSPLTTCCKAC